eukprot:TRINITY_DN2902_c0_g1_i4.p1 TRINITY_DN2902_c0_g1~~TRINITY_DN2902_c0_g1_i4.p1  ORF type:complete len:858 (+),score=179.89 TRINITY_DN2902_c0_g1_i4:1265-3838(+)
MEGLVRLVGEVGRNLAASAASEKMRSWRGRLEREFQLGGTQLARMVRGDEPRCGLTMLRRDDGSTTADVSEIDDACIEAWGPVMRMYDRDNPEPAWAPFAERFGRYVPHREQELDDITADEISAVLKTRTRGACGVDGWRLKELKKIPTPLLQRLAHFYNRVEEEGAWPPALMTALVSLIPKGEGKRPLQQRPITVTSLIYRTWATVRMRKVLRWQEEWIHPTQSGFRKGKSRYNTVMQISLQIEESLLTGKPLHGLALDYAKCFDRVPREVTLKLLETMGMSERVLRPLRAVYGGLRRRFKYALGVGRAFETTNGVLQGCPLSVVLINTLISVWARAIEGEHPGVLTPSYADDGYLVSLEGHAKVQAAADLTNEFCVLTGMALNEGKTFAFSTAKKAKKVRNSRTGGHFPATERVACLGCTLVTTNSARQVDERVRAATRRVANLGGVPLPFDVKTMLHGSICTSSVLYSAPFNRCSAAARVAYVDESVLSLWGHDTGRSRRCNKAVLVVAGYSHRNYMNVAERYRRVQFAAVQCRRDAGLVTRLNEVKALYDKRGVSPSVAGNYADERGPVGLLVADLKSVGLMWEHDLRALRTENGDVVDPLAMEPREWEHYVRVLLKKQAFAEVVKLRPEYAGIEGGVDFVATNSLRRKTGSYAVQRSLLKIVTAGVVTNDYLSHASRGSIGEECELCESGERETREHLWWHCDAYADIRAEYGLNAETAAGWPSCLRTLGVMPKDFNTGDRTLLAEKVQAMMCAINSKRLSFVDNKRTLRLRTPPWDAVAGVPGTRHESPFRGKLPAGGLWVWDASHFLALNDWLSMLEWTDEGQISSVELAIDYEAFSGLRIEKTVGFRGP